jgi:phosphate transport system protein
MTREGYRQRLERLREAVVAMGDRVRELLANACTALFTGNHELARAVIAADDPINDRSLEIERECLELVALYQPVAGDLRVVVAAFKIVTDLERVGDLATNLAEYALDSTASLPQLPDVDFERIAALALEMIDRAVEAFAEERSATCFAVADRDDELDARCASVTERIVRTLVDLRVDERDANGPGSGTERPPVGDVIADVSRTLVVVRDLERVGDHAVNVAARTLYALESSDELLV